MKKEKQKVGNAAAAAATAIAGAAAVTMSATGGYKDNYSEDSVSNEPDVAEPQELLVDGGTLPEVEATGAAPVLDGGVLADVVVDGHVSVEATAVAEPIVAEPDMASAELTPVAEPEPVVSAPVEDVAIASPVAEVIAEPDFGEEFDDDDGDLAIAEAVPGSMAEQLLHKAEEKLSDLLNGGSNTDEPDFQNMADASEFMYQD